jgi:thioredoxin-related protein
MIKFLFSFVFTIAIFSFNNAYAQLQNSAFSKLDSLNLVDQRSIVVFIQTDWCKYCLQMKTTTFKNDSVIALLNNDFYFTSLNAESKQPISYLGKLFKYRPTGLNTGVHELAEQLGTIDGEINYPAICIVNKNEILFQYGGLMQADELLKVLKIVLKR